MRMKPLVGVLTFLMLASSFIAVTAVSVSASSSIREIYADFTFTDDLYESLVVAEDSIVIDGNGYTLRPGTEIGIDLSGRFNVTVRNLNVVGFTIGVLLTDGAHDNVIMGNNVTWSTSIGILLDDASYDNQINQNGIAHNGGYGVQLESSSGNRVFHNNFIDNAQHAGVSGTSVNLWDVGYPGGGNYWDDNIDAVDFFRGPQQDILGYDGIADAPYPISGDEKDRYPLMGPFGPHVTILGLRVPVFPTPNVGLIFDEVVTKGTVSALPAEAIPPPPPGPAIVGPIYEILVTAGFTGNVLVKIIYDEADLNPEQDEADLTLWQVDLVLGDVNIDGTVNFQDLWLILRAWGSSPGHRRWDPRCDLNRDDVITLRDFWIALSHFGDTATFQEITVPGAIDTESNVIYGIASHFSHFFMR